MILRVIVALAGLTMVVLGQNILGTVEVWGSNADGELGLGSQTAVGVPFVLETFRDNGDILVDFSLGTAHGTAVTSTGSVYTWGSGTFYGLGNGATADQFVPVSVSFTPSITASGCSSGNAWTVCFDSEGALYGWGKGSNRQNGNNQLVDGQIPARFTSQPPNPVVAVSAGNDHGLALLDNGRVFSWGSGLSGQLGRPEAAGSNDGIPAAVSLDFDVADIAAGAGHSIVALVNGQVWGWGASDVGEVYERVGSYNSPVRVLGALDGREVIQVGAGVAHSIALSARNEVFAWGDATYGQTGSVNVNATCMCVDTPTMINFESLGSESVVAIAAGDYHNMAVTDGGRIFTWGRGDGSQLGLGTGLTDDTDIPRIVALQHPDVAVVPSIIDLGGESSMVYHEPCLNMCSGNGECTAPAVCECVLGKIGEDCGTTGLEPVEWAVAVLGAAVIGTVGYQLRGNSKKTKKTKRRRERERSESKARLSRQNSTVSQGSAASGHSGPPPLLNQSSQASVMQAKLAYLQAEQQAAAAKLAYAEQVSQGSGSGSAGSQVSSRGSVASGMQSAGAQPAGMQSIGMQSAGMVTMDSAQTIKPMSPAEILARQGIQRSGSVPAMPTGPAGARLQRSNTATTMVSKSSKKSGSSGKLSKRSQQSKESKLPPARAKIEEERRKAAEEDAKSAAVDISKLARPIKLYTDNASDFGDGITSVNAPFIPSMHFSDFGSDMMSMNTASTGMTNLTKQTGDRSTVGMKSKDYTASMKNATPVSQLPPETREARRANSRFARNNRRGKKDKLDDLTADDIDVDSDVYRQTGSTWR